MKQTTLTDIFLEVLSQNSNPDMQAVIARTKISLKIPECAELFDIILINAMGYKSVIKKDTVNRAIDCVIDKNKLAIDKSSLDKTEKEQQKQNCESLCHLVKKWIGARLKDSGQLIE